MFPVNLAKFFTEIFFTEPLWTTAPDYRSILNCILSSPYICRYHFIKNDDIYKKRTIIIRPEFLPTLKHSYPKHKNQH